MELSLTKLFKPKLPADFWKIAPSQSALSAGSVSECRKFRALTDYSDFITLKAGNPATPG